MEVLEGMMAEVLVGIMAVVSEEVEEGMAMTMEVTMKGVTREVVVMTIAVITITIMADVVAITQRIVVPLSPCTIITYIT